MVASNKGSGTFMLVQFFCPLALCNALSVCSHHNTRHKFVQTRKKKYACKYKQILVSEREKKKDGESYQLDDDDHDEQQESSDEICQSLLLAVSVAVSRL